MKKNSHTPQTSTALGDSVAEILARFIEGLTTPDEERQLLDTLEAREGQDTPLSRDERAAMAILRLAFDDEDYASLLVEDHSTDYDELMTSRYASPPLSAPAAERHTVLHLTPWRVRILRISTAVAAIAAVLVCVFIFKKDFRPQKDSTIALAGESLTDTTAREEPATSTTLAESGAQPPKRLNRKTMSYKQADGRLAATTVTTPAATAHPTFSKSATKLEGQDQAATQHPTQEEPIKATLEDPDGAAILAAEHQRILEMERAARERTIAVQQENTLACLNAVSPS